MEALVEKTKETMVLMDPKNVRAKFGCVKHELTTEKLDGFVIDAVNKGGKVVHGGKRGADEHGMGRFYEPTIIDNANQDMNIANLRKIGPIVAVQGVDSPATARKIINKQLYGLDTYIFSKDALTVDQMVHLLDVGTVHVNDLPLYSDDFLPVTGRKRSSRVFKGTCKEGLLKFTKSKGVNFNNYA